MIRTRDFLLFVLIVGFLLIAITATWAGSGGGKSNTVAIFGTAEENEFEAVVSESSLDRPAQAARLRAKLAAASNQQLTAVAESADSTVLPEAEAEPEPLPPNSSAVTLCGDYHEVVLAWPQTGIKTAEREGARVVYTETTQSVPKLVGSSTVMVEEVVENILLQLPMRQRPLPTTSCIPTDVIGVALDGSLIRNSDHGLYGIFSSDTLVGFALDGLPIYGTATDISVDECGGAMVGVSYRYFINEERQGILGCFVGVPVQL